MNRPVALYGGAAGDELIRELIATAPPHLRPGGLLALEIGIGQESALLDFLGAKNYHDISSKQDYAGADPIPLRQVWIRFSFTAVIRSLVRSRSAARKIPPCRSSPPPC